MRQIARITLLVLVLGAILGAEPVMVEGHHGSYRFKWPYQPGVSHPTTSFPFEPRPGGGQHGDAWDIVIGNDHVKAAAESRVTAVFRAADPNSCDPSDGGGFGNYVMVRTGTPSGDLVVTYAHLASTSFTPADEHSTRILQGDAVGMQGKTGHTRGNEPPNNCGTHLHFQFDRANGPSATAANPAHPSVIDGQSVTNSSSAGPSTNSTVGNITVSGGAIHDKYFDVGAAVTSSAVVGWTADRTESQNGCPASFLYCRLYPHYFPDPAEGHWGTRQEFRLHPDGAGREYGSIMTGRWALDSAYWVQPPFYDEFLQGGFVGSSTTRYRISMPLMDQIGNFPGLCEAAVGCVNYQRFHLGYVWNSSGTIRAQFCPDVSPAYPYPDYSVSVGDIFEVVSNFGTPDPVEPFQAWPGAWRDMDGDGTTSVGDVALVDKGFGAVCYPT